MTALARLFRAVLSAVVLTAFLIAAAFEFCLVPAGNKQREGCE